MVNHSRKAIKRENKRKIRIDYEKLRIRTKNKFQFTKDEEKHIGEYERSKKILFNKILRMESCNERRHKHKQMILYDMEKQVFSMLLQNTIFK